MGFESTSAGVAASIYLALYTIYLLLVINVVRHKGFHFLYRILLLFGLFRVSGQLCGVAFGVLGIEHWHWLIAYLVLTAEGYFSLIIAAFHFVIQSQVKQTGSSWLQKKKGSGEKKHRSWVLNRFSNISWSFCFHINLIPANALIIAGGTMLTGLDPSRLSEEQSEVNTSKGLRTAGQTIFLIETIIVILLLIYVYVKERIRCRTIYLLFAASPFLLVRGIFGILSIYVDKMNYYQLSNYDGAGLTSQFVAYEYCLATTMEFVVACLLISNYYLDNDLKVSESDNFNKIESEESL
ncbi:uncharacterized protein AC631_01049 [Debaryomyces fabryi]|uniref:Uncharacterized protein n=1 Tax=Debaryomyces fabryi TaxID=58627 RepID=A0A0V1Q3T1_9ASCO|nr:uncharacterized protein AC631_01049 [Debaryomyces fabryi]KSA03152.1 hypothetical protein AC631_01049 [Debaryomyces fabryi]CUM48430.1 unnamed protein product [Debaryomyces fabryi]